MEFQSGEIVQIHVLNVGFWSASRSIACTPVLNMLTTWKFVGNLPIGINKLMHIQKENHKEIPNNPHFISCFVYAYLWKWMSVVMFQLRNVFNIVAIRKAHAASVKSFSVEVSNNRDLAPWSLYYCLFMQMGVIFRAHPVCGESEVATAVQKKSTLVNIY